jgi:hypothetical protein
MTPRERANAAAFRAREAARKAENVAPYTIRACDAQSWARTAGEQATYAAYHQTHGKLEQAEQCAAAAAAIAETIEKILAELVEQEPFCACGRRRSRCDRSRAVCVTKANY